MPFFLPPRNEPRGVARLGLAPRQRHEHGLERGEAANGRQRRQTPPRAPRLHRHVQRHVDLHVRAADAAASRRQDQSQTYGKTGLAKCISIPFDSTSKLLCFHSFFSGTNYLPIRRVVQFDEKFWARTSMGHFHQILSSRNEIFTYMNYCQQLSRLPRVARSDPAAARRTTTPRASPASRARPPPRRTQRPGGRRLKSRQNLPLGRPRYRQIFYIEAIINLDFILTRNFRIISAGFPG